MLPKTQSYTRACDYRNFETFITMIYMILHEITTRMWFFSALMSELLSIFLPFAVCISRTSIWLVQAERG